TPGRSGNRFAYPCPCLLAPFPQVPVGDDLHGPSLASVGHSAPTLPRFYPLLQKERRLVRTAMHLDGDLPVGDREICIHAGRDLVFALVIPPFLHPELLE